MKAKSRKRLLISSVAMLLVAMLALGTATFAWFTTSTSSVADQINVTTVKSSNLKISRFDHSWVDSFHYGHTSTLYKPTSSTDGTTWYTAIAAKKDEFTKIGDFEQADALTLANDGGITNLVYCDELNIKNTGDVQATGVKISISGTFSDYVRVAVVPVDANHTFLSGVNFADYVYGKDATAYTPAPATIPQGESTAPTITPKTTREITVTPLGDNKTAGVFAKNDVAYFRIYVWFEGQDTDCYDLNGGASLPDLAFSVSGSSAN